MRPRATRPKHCVGLHAVPTRKSVGSTNGLTQTCRKVAAGLVGQTAALRWRICQKQAEERTRQSIGLAKAKPFTNPSFLKVQSFFRIGASSDKLLLET